MSAVKVCVFSLLFCSPVRDHCFADHGRGWPGGVSGADARSGDGPDRRGRGECHGHHHQRRHQHCKPRTSDDHGLYFFTGLRPAVYRVKVQASGFRAAEEKERRVAGRPADICRLCDSSAGVNATMEVTQTAPCSTPKARRSARTSPMNMYGNPPLQPQLLWAGLSRGGVTEVSGAGASDNYPSGTIFVSNGQRNATAEIRLDGARSALRNRAKAATPTCTTSRRWRSCRSSRSRTTASPPNSETTAERSSTSF